MGEALVGHADLAGVTFTGSYDVGMGLYRRMASGRYPRPCIAEMGGKNACVVTAHGDLERAATGIVRSAFGLTRPEVLGPLAGLRGGGASPTRSSRRCCEKTRGHPRGRPLPARELDGAR